MLNGRLALYYAPEADDPLWQAGCSWTGRDPETSTALAQPRVPSIAPPDFARLTAEPARYGFHATLKPPFRPTAPLTDILRAAESLAAGLSPFALPPLHVAPIGSALALLAATPSPTLCACCDAAVAVLDPFRAPAPPQELARRRQAGLTSAQQAMLQAWGYPYVFDEWTFHMTLTGRLSETHRAALLPVAITHFAPALRFNRMVRQLAVFHEPAPGAPFRLIARYRLGG